MTSRFWYAALAVAIGILGLALDFYVISSVMVVSPGNPVARSLPDMLVYFWTFLTHLANLGLILVYVADLTGRRWLAWFRQPVTRTGLAGIITLVMLFFHFMLAPSYHFTGALFYANYMLHYVTPVLFLIWWFVFNPHGSLRFGDVPMMLVPGVTYVCWVLVRGLFAREYPYAILDPGFAPPGGPANGYLGVLTGVAILVAAVAMFCVLLIFADMLLGRRRAGAAA